MQINHLCSGQVILAAVLEQKRVNVDFPVWMIDSLDKEASRIGVTRQSIIKLWLAEKIEVAANKEN